MKVFMFHYVKPFSNYYHYDLCLFEKTIKYLKNNYKIISLKEMDILLKKNSIISDDYIMLTFDDGTIDHFKYVYPILKKYNCSGLFFIPSCIGTNKMLNIQIIHKLIENVNIEKLMFDLKKRLEIYNINIENSLDLDSVALFKQLLQYKLPNKIRENALMYLVKKYNISVDVCDNYMSLESMKEMKDNNMFFGIHTVSHHRLHYFNRKEQEMEILPNMNYLIDNHLIESNLITIAFPFGSYNIDTIDIMNDNNIKYGFKVNCEPDDIDNKGVILIKRLDCNILKEGVYE